MSAIRAVLVASLVSVASASGAAQEVDAQLRAEIIELIGITNMIGVVEQARAPFVAGMRQSNKSLKPRALEVMEEVVNDELEAKEKQIYDSFVPIYAAHFSPEEIRGLLAFYRSPLGQKSLRETPRLAREAIQASAALLKEMQPQLERRMQERLEAEGLTTR
jgi:hypothetical protein